MNGRLPTTSSTGTSSRPGSFLIRLNTNFSSGRFTLQRLLDPDGWHRAHRRKLSVVGLARLSIDRPVPRQLQSLLPQLIGVHPRLCLFPLGHDSLDHGLGTLKLRVVDVLDGVAFPDLVAVADEHIGCIRAPNLTVR